METRKLESSRLLKALTRGVNEALLQHKQAGRPIAVWQDGKTVLVPPEEIEVPDQVEKS